MNFIDPQLQPILDKDAVIIPGSGGGNLQSIGNGRCYDPPRRHQGRRGPVRQHHRLSKPQAEQKPQAGGWHPIPPLSSIHPSWLSLWESCHRR